MNSQDARHSVSVAGVITDDHGRALLIQRGDNHQWEPPGGVLEPGETIHDGLRREVREETGLDVEPVALTGVYKNMRSSTSAVTMARSLTANGFPGPRSPTRTSSESATPRSASPKASYGNLPTTTPRRKPSDKSQLAPRLAPVATASTAP